MTKALKTLLALAIVIWLTWNLKDKWNEFSPPESGVEASRAKAPALNSFSSPSSEATSDKSVAFTFEDLLDAIEWVESGGSKMAIGDNGERGAYQLSEIYIDDVNRICFEQGYSTPATYEYIDAFNRHLSGIMIWRYTSYYLDRYASAIIVGYTELMDIPEFCARIHNAGPDGWRNDPEWFVRNRDYTLEQAGRKIANARAYWHKVKARMEAQ